MSPTRYHFSTPHRIGASGALPARSTLRYLQLYRNVIFCTIDSAFLRVLESRPFEYGSSPRPISTAQLRLSLALHLRPIYPVVSRRSYSFWDGTSHLRVGFVLRCFQRLSLPNVATRRCGWRHNRYTRGSSTPVLSY